MMATFTVLRTCNRGVRCLLVNIQKSGSVSPEVSSKIFSTSACSNADASRTAFDDYFRARRGPFTPEEKRGKPIMMASTHWKLERVVAVAMVGIMPAALFIQGPTMDLLFTTFVYLHGHWGMKGVLTDYLVKFVPWIQYVWYFFSILGFAGLLHFNMNDVGLTKAIKMLWAVRR